MARDRMRIGTRVLFSHAIILGALGGFFFFYVASLQSLQSEITKRATTSIAIASKTLNQMTSSFTQNLEAYTRREALATQDMLTAHQTAARQALAATQEKLLRQIATQTEAAAKQKNSVSLTPPPITLKTREKLAAMQIALAEKKDFFAAYAIARAQARFEQNLASVTAQSPTTSAARTSSQETITREYDDIDLLLRELLGQWMRQAQPPEARFRQMLSELLGLVGRSRQELTTLINTSTSDALPVASPQATTASPAVELPILLFSDASAEEESAKLLRSTAFKQQLETQAENTRVLLAETLSGTQTFFLDAIAALLQRGEAIGAAALGISALFTLFIARNVGVVLRQRLLHPLGEITQQAEDEAQRVASLIRQAESKFSAQNDVTRQISTAIRAALTTAETVAQTSNQNHKLTKDAVAFLQAAIRDLSALDRLIRTISENSHNISRVAEVMTHIANQTNMLSLNATLEAARLGERGKGFVTVAEDAHKLAEEAVNSAEEVAMIVDAANTETEKVAAISRDINSDMNKMSEAFRQIERFSAAIGAAGAELRVGTPKIDGALQNLTRLNEDEAVQALLPATHSLIKIVNSLPSIIRPV
ncbi:methyl-accepting chemotaxis protein [Azospirillaceae bacterium]